MGFGIQTFSGTTGAKLFDSTEYYQGVCTVQSGTVASVNTYTPTDGAAGVIYEPGDVVLFRPTGTVSSGVMFQVTGRSFTWTTSPLRYKLQFHIVGYLGTTPTTVDYVVVRPMTNDSPTGDYGLQAYTVSGAYTIKTFDSRSFVSANQIQVDNMWTTRFTHTSTFGTINNDEWYPAAGFGMVSGGGALGSIGMVFSNTTGSYNAAGPSPNTFSGVGISHFGQQSVLGTYTRYASEYLIRGKPF